MENASLSDPNPSFSLRELILKKNKEITGNGVFAAPDIPLKKLHGALGSYGNGTNSGDVLILMDDTVFGSAEEGLLITADEILAKEILGKARSIRLQDVQKIELEKTNLLINSEKFIKFKTIGHAALARNVALLSDYIGGIIDVDATSEANSDLTLQSDSGKEDSKVLDRALMEIKKHRPAILQLTKEKGVQLSILALQDVDHVNSFATACYKFLPTALQFLVSEKAFTAFVLNHREVFMKALAEEDSEHATEDE